MPCCEKKKVFQDYCKDHFIEYLEDKVKETIKKYKLLSKKETVAVAASGGKDSLALLYMLKKFGYNVSALAIDEGIPGYRDKSLSTLAVFCKVNKIKLRIVSFKEKIGKPLYKIVKTGERPCTVCGIFRRYLLNLYSREYDVIATGHNLDDEAQAVLMNLLKNNINALARQGPISGKRKVKNFTKRVKPLYFCTEKEMMAYSFLCGLTDDFNECPNVSKSFRLRIRDYLNETEAKLPGTKKNILNWFLSLNLKLENNAKTCKICGENSSSDICNTCKYMGKIKCS